MTKRKRTHKRIYNLGGCPSCGHPFVDKVDRSLHTCKIKVKP